MTTKTETLKIALEALESCYAGDYSTSYVIHPSFDENAVRESIIAIKEALAQQSNEQVEPVAWMHWLHGPVRLFMNKDEATLELERLNREYPVDESQRKMRPLVFGDTPSPVPTAQPKPLDDAVLYLSSLVYALDNAFISSWQSTASWQIQLDEAKEYLTTHGIKE